MPLKHKKYAIITYFYDTTLMNSITAETKQIIKLALPLMAAFLAQKGMQMVDTIMMGRLGTDALAAGALGVGVWMAVYVFCTGSMSAVGIAISHLLGAKKKDEISHILQNGIVVALILSIPCMIWIWTASHILTLFGENQMVIEKTQDFLHGLVWGFPGILCFLVLREFVSAYGRLSIVMLISFIAVPATAIANYCLMYGKLGFPALGIAGIGYACSVIQWLMAISLYIYIMCNTELKPFIRNFHSKNFSIKTMWDLARIGVPSGMVFLLDAGTIFVAAVMIGHFGSTALAAHQIALQYVSASYAFPVAISIATGLRVGHAVGANDLSRAKKSAYIGLGIGLLISIIISLVFLLFPTALISIFIGEQSPGDAQVFLLAKLLLSMATLFLCFDAAQAILNGILRGFKDTVFPMWLSCACYWLIGIPIAYYFGIYLNYATPAIWYGIIAGITILAIILFWRFLYRLRYEQQKLYK